MKRSDLTSKDTSLWSSGICTVFIASMKLQLSVDCSLRWDSSVTGLRILVKYLEIWLVEDPQNETMGRIVS